MKRLLVIVAVASLALTSTPLYAREDHRAYRDMKISECTECHRDSSVPPNHQAGWNSLHRVMAVRPETNCADCHDEAFCQDCHFGGGVYANADLHRPNDRGPNYMPRSHRSDFREIHPIAAADNPASCRRCHPVSFCNECHARFRPEDLMFVSHRKGWSDRPATPGGPAHATFPLSSCQTCHPNSVLPVHEWTNQHAQEAKRNLAACQACHPDGDICLKCHSARNGLRVNPHPDNWGSIKDRLNRAAGQRTCVKCH